MEQKTQVCCFGRRNVLKFDLKESRQMFLRDRKGKVIPYRKAEDGKGAGTNSGKAGMMKLEAGRIRGRADSIGRCVKLLRILKPSAAMAFCHKNRNCQLLQPDLLQQILAPSAVPSALSTYCSKYWHLLLYNQPYYSKYWHHLPYHQPYYSLYYSKYWHHLPYHQPYYSLYDSKYWHHQILVHQP